MADRWIHLFTFNLGLGNLSYRNVTTCSLVLKCALTWQHCYSDPITRTCTLFVMVFSRGMGWNTKCRAAVFSSWTITTTLLKKCGAPICMCTMVFQRSRIVIPLVITILTFDTLLLTAQTPQSMMCLSGGHTPPPSGKLSLHLAGWRAKLRAHWMKMRHLWCTLVAPL